MNVIFVMMLASGIWALQLMGVAMVTIMKNLTNILTISGDYFFFGRTYNLYVWLSLGLITASALVGAKTDLDFTAWGYTAQLLNCAFTAAYSLVLRGVMDRVRYVPAECLWVLTRVRVRCRSLPTTGSSCSTRGCMYAAALMIDTNVAD